MCFAGLRAMVRFAGKLTEHPSVVASFYIYIYIILLFKKILIEG